MQRAEESGFPSRSPMKEGEWEKKRCSAIHCTGTALSLAKEQGKEPEFL